MDEMRVGIRELKSKLSEYMRRVKSGQTIVVTKHGKPIGQIVPVKASAGRTLTCNGDRRSCRVEWTRISVLQTRCYQPR